MKILIVGAAVWDYYQRMTPLCEALARNGHQIVFVEPFKYRNAAAAHLLGGTPIPVPDGVTVMRRKSRLTRGVFMALAQNLDNLRVIADVRPDVVVLSDAAFGLLPALCLRFTRTRVALDYIDDWPEWSRVRWERWLLRRLLIPTIARLADVCVVTANLLGDDLQPYARRIVWIPNGAAHAPEPLTEEAFVRGTGVVYVGGLTDRIDRELLVQLAQKLPDIPFSIIGGGPRLDEFRNAAAGIPNLRVIGSVAHSAAMTAIAESAVCLIPYIPSRLTDRCFPIKLAEYWSYGRAVVSTYTAEVQRIGENRLGLIHDAHDGALAIQELITDSVRRAALGKAGYELACTLLNYDILAQQFADAIK